MLGLLPAELLLECGNKWIVITGKLARDGLITAHTVWKHDAAKLLICFTSLMATCWAFTPSFLPHGNKGFGFLVLWCSENQVGWTPCRKRPLVSIRSSWEGTEEHAGSLKSGVITTIRWTPALFHKPPALL